MRQKPNSAPDGARASARDDAEFPSWHVTLRLAILTELLTELGEVIHQRRFGLSVREVRLLLQILLHSGLTMSRLVSLAHLEKTLVSKSVTRLTQMGLVRREVGRVDARHVNLVLTAEGEQIARKVSKTAQSATEAMMASLTKSDSATFERALNSLTDYAKYNLARQKALSEKKAKPASVPESSSRLVPRSAAAARGRSAASK